MREALKQEVKKIKEEMKKNVYSLKDLNIPNKKYYCDWVNCYKKPQKEEIIISQNAFEKYLGKYIETKEYQKVK